MSLKSVKRRVNKARNLPTNTCPASRHLHIMADVLAAGKTYHMFAEEPEHCAETMYAVLASLWELRAKHPPSPAQKARSIRRLQAKVNGSERMKRSEP